MSIECACAVLFVDGAAIALEASSMYNEDSDPGTSDAALRLIMSPDDTLATARSRQGSRALKSWAQLALVISQDRNRGLWLRHCRLASSFVGKLLALAPSLTDHGSKLAL